MNRAIFIDRDGVINKLPPKYPNDGIGDIRNYITKWEDFEFLPGVLEAFGLIKESDYISIIVSNQGGAIGRKLVDYGVILRIFSRMVTTIRRAGGKGTFYFCPHLISDNCACIKPKPGMLYQAAIEHDIVLEESWMIGDQYIDVQAGLAAGVTGNILIRNYEKHVIHPKCYYIPSLFDAVKHILKTP